MLRDATVMHQRLSLEALLRVLSALVQVTVSLDARVEKNFHTLWCDGRQFTSFSANHGPRSDTNDSARLLDKEGVARARGWITGPA